MGLDRAEVRRIAGLARLALEPQELARLTTELNDILAHFTLLQSVDVAGIEPFATAAEGAARLRDDTVGADALHAPPAALAPAWQSGFFTVPRLPAQQGQPTRAADAPPEDGA